jgi:predicted DNA-binding transcriptional regulator YafY
VSQTERLSRIRERLNAPLVRGRERGGGVLDSAQAGTGYGIFAGDDIRLARMRFSARSARWVSAERWHPNPHGHWDSEGRWCLRVPYADPRELVMDILRHVPDVQVLDPPELRQEVIRRLQAGLSNMGVDE